MSQSTDGHICFGILLEEGAGPFPWDEDDEYGYGDIEEWWRKINGYKPPFEIWEEHVAEYLPGVTLEMKDEYYNHRRDWKKVNPVPVELVNYCSCDYPMYIIALSETCKNANRGYPEAFEPNDLVVSAERAMELINFCKKYGIDMGEEYPRWWLSSYWG